MGKTEFMKFLREEHFAVTDYLHMNTAALKYAISSKHRGIILSTNEQVFA